MAFARVFPDLLSILSRRYKFLLRIFAFLLLFPALTGAQLIVSGSGALAPQADTLPPYRPPYGGRAWDGNNPFFQPANTTDYYGSGDTNADGELSVEDVNLAEAMSAGSVTASIRTDVDGNGRVDSQDVLLLQQALAGATLPAWWNILPSREARNAWLDRVLEIDHAQLHPERYWYGPYGLQLFIHTAFYRSDLSFTPFNGGPTIYNLPIYSVWIMNSNAPNQEISAILVGENPQDLRDWRFINSRTYATIVLGSPEIPYGSTVWILLTNQILIHGGGLERKIFIVADENGGVVQDLSPDFLLSRPAPDTRPIDNRLDLWYPHILPVGTGLFFYERIRDDFSRMNDIFLTDLPLTDPPAGVPLTFSSQYSHLLDFFLAPDGQVHLLWAGEEDYSPGVFYGRFDLDSRSLVDVSRVSTGDRKALEGKILVTESGEIHAFWFQYKANFNDPYTTGIYWTKRIGNIWQEIDDLTPQIDAYLDSPVWGLPLFYRNLFDVAETGQGQVALIWPEGPTSQVGIRERLLSAGEWGPQSTILYDGDASTYPVGVELVSGTNGRLNLIYAKKYTSGSIGNHWGNLIYTYSDGGSWSDPVVVDTSQSAGFPNLVPGNGDELFLTWIRNVSDHYIPVWRRFSNGRWLAEQVMSTTPDSQASYPSIGLLYDGSLVIAWSSATPQLASIETVTVPPQIVVPIDIRPGNLNNHINWMSPNNIAVGLLSKSGFDALTQIDPFSLTFGRTGVEPSLHILKKTGEPDCRTADINSDGLMDLICYFEIPKTGFQWGDTVGILQGYTWQAVQVVGQDMIKFIP